MISQSGARSAGEADYTTDLAATELLVEIGITSLRGGDPHPVVLLGCFSFRRAFVHCSSSRETGTVELHF